MDTDKRPVSVSFGKISDYSIETNEVLPGINFMLPGVKVSFQADSMAIASLHDQGCLLTSLDGCYVEIVSYKTGKLELRPLAEAQQSSSAPPGDTQHASVEAKSLETPDEPLKVPHVLESASVAKLCIADQSQYVLIPHGTTMKKFLEAVKEAVRKL